MKYLVFVTPKDFRDESLAAVELFFGKWSVGYDIGSYTKEQCKGSHGTVVSPTVNPYKISTSSYDGIILIDGAGVDSYKLYEFRPLLDMVYMFNQNKKPIVAISNAVKIVARANIIKDKKICVFDDETKRMGMLFYGIPSKSEIEIAGNLITIKDSQALENSFQQILKHINVF